MKRGIVLLGLSAILRVAIAQSSTPATPSPKSSDAAGEASADRIYGPKDGAKPPKILSRYDPEYPRKSRDSGKQGIVVLRLIVGGNGVPREIGVVRSLSPDLDAAAVDAVAKWKFAPATKDGKPVTSQINVEVSFRHN